MNRVIVPAVVVVAVAVLTVGVAHKRVGRKASENITLSLYCAAGLRPAVAEIIERFEGETGVKVECTYGAANLLLGQLKLVQRGDIFIPGDHFYVEQARAENLVDEFRTVAYLVPVIMVRKGNPLEIHSLGDLTRDGVRLGLADERTAAVGRAARQVLEKSGVSLDAVENNVRFTSTTVHELGDAIKLGHLDAVIVWSAIAHQFDDAGEIVSIPAEQSVTASIPAAIISSSQDRAAARRFIDFLASERAKEVFRKYHYDTADPSEEAK